MNESIAAIVLDRLLRDTEKNAGRYYDPINNLEEALYELNNQREKPLPRSLPKRPDTMTRTLRKHFKDSVTFISLVLHHYFPETHFFYRVSRLEAEIFAGFDFLKAVVPGFAFGFSRVGRTGFARYLKLNKALLEFARACWPRDKDPQKRLNYFLYQGLGRLFQEKPIDNRYWVMATQQRYFWALDEGKDIWWSGRKEMQRGDLAFMYRTSPVSAITDLYRASDEPRFDPWYGWNGFRVDMERVCAIKPIPFAEMKVDSIFGQFGIVKRNFVGTVSEPVPPVVYNRLLEYIDPALRRQHKLRPVPVSGSQSTAEGGLPVSHSPTLPTPELSGRFALEADFEEKVVIPLLKQRWNFKHQAQYARPVWVGSQEHQLRVDFLVSDNEGPVTLFEDKLRIISDEDLEPAVGQAKSYALLLGLPSFVVASPEGMWLYSLERDQEKLMPQLPAVQSREQQEKRFRDLLLSLRQ